MNIVILEGRLTKDATIKEFENVQIASFSLAVDRDYIKKDGTRETDFINIEYARKDLSKLLPYLSKGAFVSIEGKLNLDKHTKDGETKYFTKVRAKNLNLLGGVKKENNEFTNPLLENQNENFESVEDDSDIPF